MTLEASDLKKGMTIDMDGVPFLVVDVERTKMQQRAPVTRIRLKDLKTGRVLDKSFSGYDVKLKPANVEYREAQYIYQDNDMYYFMDSTSFEQFPLGKEQLGESLNYLVEQMNVEVVFHHGEAIMVELPTSVDLKVVEAPPGVKGDTAQGGTKPAVLETGKSIQVPLFINVGDKVKVDTRTGQYLSRV